MRSYNGFSGLQRIRAQAWLRRQWNAGLLDRPSRCFACGQDRGIIEAHAEDYSEPFAPGKTDQFHLCFTCHMMVHSRFGNPHDWRYYKSVVKGGGRYPPTYRRDIGGFHARHNGGKQLMPDEQGRPPLSGTRPVRRSSRKLKGVFVTTTIKATRR